MRPMSTLARRIAALSVLVLSLAMIAVVGLRGIGIPSSTPTASAATPPPSQAAASEDLLTVLDRIEEQVTQLRKLPAAHIGPPQILTRAELAKVLPGLLTPPLDNTTLRALGLLGATQDIVALTDQLYVAQVAGFYDFDTKRMVVVTDAGMTPAAEITYAHEYTHALQDASFDSSAAQKAVAGKRDRELALLGLEEGDATTSMVLWAVAHLTPDELAGVVQAPVPDMTGIPGWMVRLLEFPYLSGAEFVGQLYASGGWDAVDAAYRHLPESTEQILHPTAYTQHQAPDVVKPLDLAGALGAGWAAGSKTTLGEAWIGTWLDGIGVKTSAADQAAAGWGGDQLSVATGPEGSWALGWRITWDTPADATEFEAAYAGAEAGLPFESRVVHGSDTETIVLQASSADVLSRMATLAGS